jgi:23S rRNA (guanine2445-N2)-methyltransferase / 23S rRNA (guanine2069-N7)-methyltransferase
LNLIATSAFGLESAVVYQLKQLGYNDARGMRSSGWVSFSGDASAIARANVFLQSADRVLIEIGSFRCRDFETLFDTVYALDWQEWIPAVGAFPVRGRSIQSQLSSVPACQRAVKKAIVEKLRAAHGVTELPESEGQYTVEIALVKDTAYLTLDTTGPGLNKRGYHVLGGEAPVKETLAAAMVNLSFWRPDRPLWDPFCGSGTIAIEAAMIGRNIAPGLRRSFSADRWPAMDPALWQGAREEARSAILPELPERILATDSDERSLSLARSHAEKAGVADDIHFQQMDFREISSKREYGCLITNPPYGRRVGQRDDLENLYRDMPEVFRRLKTWSFFVLTAWSGLERIVGRKADRRRKLYNGRIECTYYQFHGPRPGETPRGTQRESTDRTDAPAFGGIGDQARHQAEVFSNRLAKMARHLRRWPRKGITCYRLYDRDIPEVPVSVDVYEDRLHICEYERPHERSPAEHADWLDLIARTGAQTLGIDPGQVYLKTRQPQRGSGQYEKQDASGEAFTVNEGGLCFEVNLRDYLDTGLFLDHRHTRRMVRDDAAGKRFLNLFAYTGSFSVYAAAGGAASTTTVDWSNTYLDWARRNMEQNGFTGPEHTFVREDVVRFVREHAAGEQYDLAVVDPPTFSNSKRTEEIWDVQRDHAGLLNDVLELMPEGGKIYFSSNFRRLKFDPEAIRADQIHEISKQTVPEDFRNKRIHRCWVITK